MPEYKNEKVRGFAPGNISCVFKVVEAESAEEMHSLGMGFTVNRGVLASVSLVPKGQGAILFNNQAMEFPPVREILRGMYGAEDALLVEFSTELPLGSGYGLSGACCLSAAYALNELLGLKLSESEIGMRCHVAEVHNLTGLGDVCGQFHGGCMMKVEAGKPLSAVRVPVGEQEVFVRTFGPLSTAEVLGSQEARALIASAGEVAVESLVELKNRESVSFEEVCDISLRFAEDSALLQDSRVKNAIEQVHALGGKASMIMLGNAVFATVPFEGADRLSVGTMKAGLV